MRQLKCLAEQAESPVREGIEAGRLASVLSEEGLLGGLAAISRGRMVEMADRDLVWRSLTRWS